MKEKQKMVGRKELNVALDLLETGGFTVLGPEITREMQRAGLQVICPGSMKDLPLVEAIFFAMARAGNLAKKL